MKLTKKQFQCIALHVEGKSQGEIVRIVGAGRRSVVRWMADDDFQEELTRAYRRAYIHDVAEARNVTVDLMRNAEKESIRFAAAIDIQDRGGLKAMDKVDVTSGGESLNGLKDAEAAITAGRASLKGLGKRCAVSGDDAGCSDVGEG